MQVNKDSLPNKRFPTLLDDIKDSVVKVKDRDEFLRCLWPCLASWSWRSFSSQWLLWVGGLMMWVLNLGA